MEVVSVKFQEDVLKKIDNGIKEHNFNSRTEFIREAVRDKLAGLGRDELLKEFLKTSGKAKKKTTDADLRRAREIAYKELAKERGWD